METTDIIFTNGCFDILHVGHVKLLEHCKSLGGKVIVGVNSDDSIKRLKGPSRPINNQNDRAMFLRAIRYVDEVYIFEEDTPYQLIKQLRPKIIVKGGDYNPLSVIGNDISKVCIFNYIEGYSTTSMINKVKNK